MVVVGCLSAESRGAFDPANPGTFAFLLVPRSEQDLGFNSGRVILGLDWETGQRKWKLLLRV